MRDGQLVLKRTFTASGTNRQFINGSPTTLDVLAAIGEWLVDMHGPHDHQSLLSPAKQLAILDAFGGLEPEREAFGALVRRRAALEAEKSALVVDEKTYAQQLDLLQYVNGLSLVLISFCIWYEAFAAFSRPVEVHDGWMIWVAAAGVVMNGAIALILMRGHRDINLRSADCPRSATRSPRGGDRRRRCHCARPSRHGLIRRCRSASVDDPLVLDGIIRESLNILLEGTPRGMELNGIADCICKIPGVNSVHDLHVWEHRQRHPFAFVSRGHRRYARIGERGHSAHYTRGVTGRGITSTILRFSLSIRFAKSLMAA